jgi:hypothetical protein
MTNEKEIIWEARDGFVGNMIGTYSTREGEAGAVLQQIGTKVVHVYRLTSIQPSRNQDDSSRCT